VSSYAERRARSMLVPWDEDTPDARGFWKYAEEHYGRAIAKAWNIADKHSGPDLNVGQLTIILVDKLASPLVYLYQSWSVMAPEKKAKYSEELAKIHERVKREVEEAFKK